jgi:hypothetical protein
LTNENIEQQSFFSKIKSSFFNEPKAKNIVLAESIVKMAENSYDYFEKNIENLEKYQIYDASKNMYLLCLTATLEEWKLIKTVDWKDGLDDILFALKSICEIDFKDIDRRKFAKKGAEKIFALLNSEIENKTDKTLFCIDTDSDSYSFGLIEKSKIERLIKLGKDSKIEIYQFI